jgi:hypothetical protein
VTRCILDVPIHHGFSPLNLRIKKTGQALESGGALRLTTFTEGVVMNGIKGFLTDGLIAHPIRQGRQLFVNRFAYFDGGDSFFQRSTHAQEPRIALGLTYSERQMPHAQAGMPALAGVQVRTAQPFAEVFLEHDVHVAQIRCVHSAYGRSFRQGVHAAVKGID